MSYTPEEYQDLLKEIANSGGDTPKMLELLQKLRDDYDEREGELRRYKETKDKETPEGEKEEREKIREESREDDKEDRGERLRAYEGKRDMVSREDYEELRRKYIERFFSTPEQAKKSQEEDVRKDSKSDSMSFDELFKKREG